MEQTIVNHEKGDIAVFPKMDKTIATPTDFLELLYSTEARTIAIKKEDLPESFFELRNGLAGEFLQKISNYKKHLIILGDFSKIDSKSLKDFIYESNRNGEVVFAPTIDDAIRILR